METNWFYTVDGQEKKGPVPESELRQLLASGQVTAATLVWREGMANWAPAGHNSHNAAAALPSTVIGATATAAARLATTATRLSRPEIPAISGAVTR